MKIRKGFVSNSSSSSFVLIGLHKASIIENMLLKDGIITEEEYGDEIDMEPLFGRMEGFGQLRSNNVPKLCFFSGEDAFYYAGFDMTEFPEHMTVAEMKTKLIQDVKEELDIVLEESDLIFQAIEAGWG